MTPITFVTGNENKVREAVMILGDSITHVKLDLDEIQSMDLAVIVEHKARQAYAKLKRPVMVEDVSFEIEKWNGFPGPFVKWLREFMGYAELCRILGKNRKANWRVMYGYFDGKKFISATAVVSGSIAKSPRRGGWGFDVVFIPNGQSKTLGEMGENGKIKFSARAN